jgi:cell division protein FtsL
MSVELGYSISDQQATKEDLLAENKSLKVEISTLKSSGRLQTIANDLGFRTPEQGQVIYLWQEE